MTVDCRDGWRPHGAAVNIPGANHLDRRRTLLPRDYLDEPDLFGRSGTAVVRLPPGGDEVSARIAAIQHDLVRDWRVEHRPSSGEIRRLYGMSRQTWSRITLGERWAGETGLAVLHASWRRRRAR